MLIRLDNRQCNDSYYFTEYFHHNRTFDFKTLQLSTDLQQLNHNSTKVFSNFMIILHKDELP